MISRIIFTLICITLILNIFVSFPKCDIAVLTPQQTLNGKWGYVDETGKFIIRPKFESALPFKEGLAVISIHKKYGYIDAQGKPVIRPQFDDARSFSEDMAAVMIYDQNSNRKWGFIDKTGKFLIMPQYDDVTDFSGLMARVELNGKIFCINKSGEAINDAFQ